MKKLVINDCKQCPHFDNEYWGYNEVCMLLDRKIPSTKGANDHEIPEDCPLADEPQTCT